MQRSLSSRPPPPPSSSTTAAQVRARHPQMLLALVETEAPDVHPDIMAALREQTREAIAGAIPMTWLPIEIDIEVVEAVAARVGPTVTASLMEGRQREEMGSALFDGFVKTALRVLGASPASMVKRLPAGWGHLFRNAGAVEILSSEEHQAVTRFAGLPAACLASAPWMAALPVGLATLYEIVGVEGTVDCRIEDAALGHALVTFRWR